MVICGAGGRVKVNGRLAGPLGCQRGFSLLELGVAMLLIVILVGLVILGVTGFFGGARESAMEVEVRNVKSAVDAYMIQSLQAPTADGKLPASGEYALVDFYASFSREGESLSLYPHFISDLPKHHDEGVWLIDSAALVSVALNAEDY